MDITLIQNTISGLKLAGDIAKSILGGCQGSCHLKCTYAALSNTFGSFSDNLSGLSLTSLTGSQLRVCPDHLFGIRIYASL